MPTEVDGPHIQGDVLEVLDHDWDLMVAHPPCTYLSRAGARWWGKGGREWKGVEAALFVRALWDAPIERVAIENPIGQLNLLWRYPDQTIEPWHFGDPYTKQTCLWLRGLPGLMATMVMPTNERWVKSNVGLGKRLGQAWHPGHAKTAADASRTFPGIAAAMADQWGALERVHPT
jgi:hypothetical protein